MAGGLDSADDAADDAKAANATPVAVGAASSAELDSIRADLTDAHHAAWAHVAAPGTWLTGAERVAIAAECRGAMHCALCSERKAALSPFSVDGEHDVRTELEAPMVDQIHRVTTDPQRLTQAWVETLCDAGLSPEKYVEALGVTVLVISIDAFQHALGQPLEPLPEPCSGEPSRRLPRSTVTGEAWVPMMDPKKVDPEYRSLFATPVGAAPYVVRALSLVPAEVLAWSELSDAQYIPRDQMMSMERLRALDRSQVELVAGRVSALNECFY